MLDPDAVAARSFGTSFRGYDPEEVRRFLLEVAADLRSLAAGALEGIDDERASALLGEEAGRLLGAARASATAIEAKAEERAAEVVREAQEEAIRLRSSLEAERDRAYAEGAARAEEALAEADRSRVEVEEAARAEADRLVAEAVAAREHVLRDLARRRTAVRTQVEQLQAAREKLLEALAEVARSVDEARGRVVVALPEAKLAADAAARRVQGEPEVTVDQLESELEAFRLAGIPLGPGAAPGAAVELEADVEAADAEAGSDGVLVVGSVEVVTDDAVVEEGRRSSSVRVFRTRRDPAPAIGLAEAELHEVEPGAPFEEVRVLPADEEPAAAATPPPEQAPEPEVSLVEERPSTDTVDALFARLRAGREDRTAAAEEVLAEATPAEPEAEVVATEPEPETETEPEQDEVVVDDVAVHVGGGDDRRQLLGRRDELLAPPMAALLRRMKRVLADEQNAVLEALRRAGPDGAVPAGADLAERWAAAAEPDLAAAAAAGVTFLDGAAQAVELADIAAELATTVAAPLGERLGDVIRRAEGDPDVAAESVRAACREWRTRRLADGVEHAARSAFGRGALAAAPPGSKLCWVVDDGGTPCPDAEDNSLAGAVLVGEPFPTGHRHPPAHPGCRCVLARSG